MKTTFRSLPPEFVKNIIALCRDAGETWLDSLPACIEMLAKRWSISVQEHFGNLSYNYVATATLDTGEPAVLKIGPPALNDVEIFSEAKFLRDRAGAGTVKSTAQVTAGTSLRMALLYPG